MTRSEIIRTLNEDYARLRAMNEQEHDRRLNEAVAKQPEIGAVVQAEQDLFFSQARMLLAAPQRAQALSQETRERAAQLHARLEALLRAAGFPADYLEPIYRCPKCRDKGYVGADVRTYCTCFQQRLIERMYDNARERGTANQRFETFNEALFPQDVKLEGGQTQRDIALATRNLFRKYADTYPHGDKLGILLLGQTGLGKTFLLHCLENRLIERGYAPICVTAYRLFETMRGCHFQDDDKRQEFDQLVHCDILLIDDLGTEPVIKNITREYLFTLLNERMAQRRHTVAATNLSMVQLMNLYGERVFSRLCDQANMYVTQLKGKDLRTMPGGTS